MKFRIILFFIGVSVCLTAVLLLMNDVYIAIRMKELKLSLQRSNQEEGSMDHMDLIMKYTIHKRMYENSISKNEADIIENQIYSLTEKRLQYDAIPVERYRFLAMPALFVINTNRFFLGKPAIVDMNDNDAVSYLEIAYYFERNNYYKKSLENYKRVLSVGNLSRTMEASIMLHIGYCHALLGEYDPARKMYRKIISGYSGEGTAITATILLTYLEGFKSESDRIMQTSHSAVEKSEKLYILLGYNEALKMLSRVEATGVPADLAKVRYYKARCYDDMGETKKSLDTLAELIIENPASEFARLANRRILLIGSRMANAQGIRDLSIKINKTLIKDPVFDEMVAWKAQVGKDSHDRPLMGAENLGVSAFGNPTISEEFLEKINDMTEKTKEIDFRGMKVKVKLNDGNLFLGTVLESDAQTFLIATSIGSVKILKENIIGIEIMK